MAANITRPSPLKYLMATPAPFSADVLPFEAALPAPEGRLLFFAASLPAHPLPVFCMDFAADLILENARAHLRPLALADFEALQAPAFDPEIWRYTLAPAHTPADLQAYLHAALAGRAQGLRYPFAIIDRDTGALAGSTSYYHVSADEQRLSIGYTWLGAAFQRSGLNRACKHLLLSHAFGPLGCERVELETDGRNAKSRAAMRRMGATEEGTLRSHRHTQNGVRRDTVIFSILRAEWPGLRQTVFQAFDNQARG